jgi:hypothetical protein
MRSGGLSLDPAGKSACGGGAGGRTPDHQILRSGSVSNHFQFSGSINCGKELIDASHRRLFQLGIAALAALKYGQQPEDHNRRISSFER